jgi:hypothetical protein
MVSDLAGIIYSIRNMRYDNFVNVQLKSHGNTKRYAICDMRHVILELV